MKTEDLIHALVADGQRAVTPFGRMLLEYLLPGLAIAAAVYAAFIGMRPQLPSLLMGDPRIAFKIGLMVLLALLLAPLVLRLARPGARIGASGLVAAIVPLILMAAIGVEFAVVPEPEWMSRLIGHNAKFCLFAIPLLAGGPFAALLLALRQGAPAHPARTGAAAGLLAGAIGAAFYATHCPDDSPFFVATWYSLAIAIVTLAGAWLGARLLRW